jgi:GDPmannose 4,6-dehydratase
MPKALIGSITGQDGSYLAELLRTKGYEVHGLKRSSSSFNTQRVDYLYVDSHNSGAKFFRHYSDLRDASSLAWCLAHIRPDEIYNLGAQSHVKVSFETPEYTSEVVGTGTIRPCGPAGHAGRLPNRYGTIAFGTGIRGWLSRMSHAMGGTTS